MKLTILAVLMALAFNADATNNNGCQGNCPSDGGGDSSATATGGNAVAGGGSANAGAAAGAISGAAAGAVSGSYSEGGSVGDIRNTASGGDGGSAVALGGAGGHGGDSKAYGGNQSQGQGQGQQMEQSNVGVNSQGQSSTNVSGSKSIAQMASENTNKVNASSANANNSQASGNTTVTNVGGDSTLVERNAPPVFLGNLTATMSCAGGFNAGASDRNGSGAFGFTWISSDCRSVVIAREFVGIGMPDVGCRVFKTTKGYKRAVKADPSLADVDCTAKPAPAAAPVLVAPELAPRIPRG